MKDFLNRKISKKQNIFWTYREPSSNEPKDRYGWSKGEDNLLLDIVNFCNDGIWKSCANILKNKNIRECKRRYKFLLKSNKKGRWTKEEDKMILAMYENLGKNWVLFSKIIKTRTPKQIRIRFLDFIDSKLDKSPFKKEEDEKLIKIYQIENCDWKLIREYFPNRPFNMLKRRLKKLIPGFKIVNYMKYCRKNPNYSNKYKETKPKAEKQVLKTSVLESLCTSQPDTENNCYNYTNSTSNENLSSKILSNCPSISENPTGLNNELEEIMRYQNFLAFMEE